MTKKLLSVAEVAKRLEMSKRRVVAILNDGLGRFPGAYKIGYYWGIPEEDVEEFERKRKAEERK